MASKPLKLLRTRTTSSGSSEIETSHALVRVKDVVRADVYVPARGIFEVVGAAGQVVLWCEGDVVVEELHVMKKFSGS